MPLYLTQQTCMAHLVTGCSGTSQNQVVPFLILHLFSQTRVHWLHLQSHGKAQTIQIT
jgi:hypothetical protein